MCLVTQSCPTLCDPMYYSLPGFSVHEDSPGKNTRVGCQCPPPGDLSNPGIEPMSPPLQADSLPTEPAYMWYYNDGYMEFKIHEIYIANS